MLLKSGTIAVITLYASHVLAIPYDYSYPSTIETGTTTTTTNNDDSDNGLLDEIGSGIQRAWDALTCGGDCRKSWGWTGNHFGGDPWGGVLKVGDPIPYVPDVSVHSNPTTTAESTGTSATGRFGILDITTTVNNPAQTSVVFSVFNVPTLTTSSSTTTSTTPTSTPPPPPTTTTESPSPTPTPEPEPETTQQPEPQPEPTTNSPEQAQPTNNNNNNNNNNTPTVVPNTGNQGASADQVAYLAAHNSARALHGASPVTWSTQLEGFAQEWANNCQFQHSGGKFGRVGENLAAGTGNYGISDMVGDWMAEVTEYNPSNPVASHFTQVVWKATTQIGCAKATCNGIFQGFGAATYYVCEYSEAGNVSGQFSANVQK